MGIRLITADDSVPHTYLAYLLNKQFEESAHSRPDCKTQKTKLMREESRDGTHYDRVALVCTVSIIIIS